MSTQTNSSYFYKDKPIFGLDIGFGSAKVVQIANINGKQSIIGYGVHGFEPSTIKDGVIVEPEKLAKSIYELFDKHLVGEISTRRVAVALPAPRTFNRPMKLPKLKEKDFIEAVRLEAEQYIPFPLEELYLDYEIINKNNQEIELLAVAAPRKIVDSYADLVRALGLEAAAFETTISSAARLFMHAEQSDVPTILIDFGSISTDISIYDGGLVVTGTVPGGGDIFTDLIRKALDVKREEADVIKSKYGLGVSKKQAQIKQALTPALEEMVREVRRMIRYYEERFSNKHKVSQIVTMGGGANMPGLSDHLTDMLRLPARMCSPWQHINFGDLQPPNELEKSLYVTAIGLALINPKEVFAS